MIIHFSLWKSVREASVWLARPGRPWFVEPGIIIITIVIIIITIIIINIIAIIVTTTIIHIISSSSITFVCNKVGWINCNLCPIKAESWFSED